MAKQNETSTKEMDLVSQTHALEFCAGLGESKRRVLGMCIDGELGGAARRPGSDAWEAARLRAVSHIAGRDLDLDEMAGEMLPYLDDVSGDEQIDTGRRALKARVNGYAEFLREEAGQAADEDN